MYNFVTGDATGDGSLLSLEAAKYGRFIMSNGCPLAFDAPRENISAMVKTAAIHEKA